MLLCRCALALCVVLSLLIGVIPPAAAQDQSRVEAAFRTWLAEIGSQGVLAVRRNGQDWLTVDAGRAADAPIELASLSKAITGVCAAKLVQAGVLTWQDRFDDVTGRGPDLTLAELVTQSGGIRKDSSQRVMRRTFGQPWSDAAEQVLAQIEARGRFRGATGIHFYNNENYVLAGLMIEAATDRAYEEVCAEVAIAPAGVSADLSPHSGAFAAWGGWRMSARDHAIWHSHWFAGADAIARAPKAFPFAAMDDGRINYGLGTYFRTLEPGNTFWHFGALCFPDRMNAGSYVASLFGEWTIVAAYDACIDWDAMFALDQAVTQALFGVPE